MNLDLLIAAVVFAQVGIVFVAILIGRKTGMKRERERCCYLCHQAFLQTGSGSARRIWNAIDSGAGKLMDADKFFSKPNSTE